MAEPPPWPEVVVAGYASIDRAWTVNLPPAPGRTALLGGPVEAPRFGGCGPTAARRLARLGRRTGLVSWLGDDADGRAYLAALEADGVDVRGVEVAAGQPSPRCYLFYDPEGGATCCYHPSASAGLGRHGLAAGARAVLAHADVLALTVAPAALTAALLDALPAGARVAWGVKADPDAYPPALRRRLVATAGLVCLNRGELGFVAAALADPPPDGDPDAALEAIAAASGAVVVATLGAAGCRVRWPGGAAEVPAAPVPVTDPTGAGDAFFGALVAAWAHGEAPEAAARAATADAAAFLAARREEGAR